MNQQGFEEYTYLAYGKKNGTGYSYVKAIQILDNIFRQEDVFNLNGHSLTEMDDEALLQRIADYVLAEENKLRAGNESIFRYGLPTQKSYPTKRFCSAAMRHLQRYQAYEPQERTADEIAARLSDGKSVSTELLKHFDITKEGRDQESKSRVRIGQAYYRKMILSLYSGKCCVTGVDIPMLLRASHIVGWAEDKANRMNPENGLCLSGTYDLAFDQHLISFDEKYRMILGHEIRDHFTNAFTKDCFERYEGKQINLPSKYLPSQSLLEAHREQLR